MAINLTELKNKSKANKQIPTQPIMDSKQPSSTTASSVSSTSNFNDRLDKLNINANDQISLNENLLKRSNNLGEIPTNNNHIGHDFITNTNPYAKVEEKVAHLSLQVNQVIIRPYLQQALDYLKSSKVDAINAYNQLSDEIANEVKIISQNTAVISNNLKEAKNIINRTQEVIRNRYNNATEEEIANCSLNLDYEYNVVAEHYELTLQLSQELAKYKSRIDTLLASQNLLDESIVPSISRIQLEIENLELFLHSLDSSDYASIIAKKTGRNVANLNYNHQPFVGRGKALNNLVEQTGVYNYNNLNQTSTPNLSSMNRYEDPLNASINLQNTPVKNNQLNNNQFNQVNQNNEYARKIDEEKRRIAEAQSKIDALNNLMNQPQANQSNNNQVNSQYNQQVNNQQQYPVNNQVPLTRKEMRLQRKLQRQQMRINAMNARNAQSQQPLNQYQNDDFKMQSMQQQYSDNLAAMQRIQESNINIQNDLVQMQQERQLRLQEQMQQQFANMMQQQQMQQQMVQQFYQSMQQPILNVGMTMTNPSTMTYPVYQTVPQYQQPMQMANFTSTNPSVIEKKMEIDTLEENLAKSPRDKIFVVRPAKSISVNDTKKLNDIKNLRTIKVIK